VVQHYRLLEDVSLQNSWLTIGVFDGVHRGHQELIERLTAGAHRVGAPAVVLTFYPHPAVVLGRRTDFKYLTTPDEKAQLLDGLDVDVVITQTFDHDLAQLSAREFMTRLRSRLGLSHLIVGYDFALGHDREGDVTRLSELGQELGYQVEQVLAVEHGNDIVSSRAIRACLAEGCVADAAEWLGRYYTVSGPVVHGDGRGRTINFPTANIKYLPEKVIPANGIYATWAWVGDKKYQAMTSIGIRPTFTPEDRQVHIEAYILDFDRDLYGQELRLEFVKRLRGEEKFDTVDELVEQIHKDVEQGRALLAAK
jgi:riboflavin kinase/FMN adenylyltransferase